VSGLVLTYHAVGPDGGALAVDADLFRAHVDELREAEAAFLTVSELAAGLRRGTLPDRAVAITFDDGLSSVAEAAAPVLAEYELCATVFCVAGRLGGDSSWPSARADATPLPLMNAQDLAELAAAGFEIGSHGMDHAPLVTGSDALLGREIAESQLVLEQAVGVTVRSFAYPYGAEPSEAARRLVERTYDAACTTSLGRISRGADPLRLPRVDAHYVRRPALLRRALTGTLDPYLRARAIGAGARRRLVKDYA
jgi:peptidoglycan/xylan/chitin deacetylase (PgdA/CDA1 family)